MKKYCHFCDKIQETTEVLEFDDDMQCINFICCKCGKIAYSVRAEDDNFQNYYY